MDMLIIKNPIGYGYIRLNKPVPVKKKPLLNYLILSASYCLYLRSGGDEGVLHPYSCRTPYSHYI